MPDFDADLANTPHPPVEKGMYKLDYDKLVIAVGAYSASFGIPGVGYISSRHHSLRSLYAADPPGSQACAFLEGCPGLASYSNASTVSAIRPLTTAGGRADPPQTDTRASLPSQHLSISTRKFASDSHSRRRAHRCRVLSRATRLCRARRVPPVPALEGPGQDYAI